MNLYNLSRVALFFGLLFAPLSAHAEIKAGTYKLRPDTALTAFMGMCNVDKIITSVVTGWEGTIDIKEGVVGSTVKAKVDLSQKGNITFKPDAHNQFGLYEIFYGDQSLDLENKPENKYAYFEGTAHGPVESVEGKYVYMKSFDIKGTLTMNGKSVPMTVLVSWDTNFGQQEDGYKSVYLEGRFEFDRLDFGLAYGSVGRSVSRNIPVNVTGGIKLIADRQD